MHLQTLLESLPIDVSITPREVDPRVAALTSDSREVTPGALFVAVPGLQVDGHDFIPQALEAGAVGVVGERPRLDLGLPADFPTCTWTTRELPLAGCTPPGTTFRLVASRWSGSRAPMGRRPRPT